MSISKPSLTVIMPVFNEELNIKRALVQSLASLDGAGLSYELIIVNDASIDKTGPIAQELISGKPQLRYAAHERNQGIGGAFSTGVALAQGEYVILIPADNPLTPQDLSAFASCMGKADIIVGFRQDRVGYNLLLKSLSYVYNQVLVPLLFGLRLKDVNWIQMYRVKLFHQDGIKIESRGVFFFTEVLVKAYRLKASMVEIPIAMTRRVHGRPSISRLPVILKTLREMISFFLRYSRSN